MLSVGVDIIEIPRIRESIRKFGSSFLRRVFTQTELDFCLSKREPASSLAGRFAAKEAFRKAHGSPLRWKDVEIVREESCPPRILFQGRRHGAAVSISHSRNYAIATVIIEDK